MKEIKKQVENILRSYPTMKKEIMALEFELGRFSGTLHPETIENMVFSHGDGERVSATQRSDKTADIAIEHFDSLINGEYHVLRTLISNMRFELHRIEYYLSLLPGKEAAVIEMFYFETLTWDQISEKTLLAIRTLQRHKDKALAQLAHFYSIVDKLDAQNLDIRLRVRFMGNAHEERFIACTGRAGSTKKPGSETALYILSGCEELWQALDRLYDFETGEVNPDAANDIPLSGSGVMLLQLAEHFADGFDLNDVAHTLRRYFPRLERTHLELAIEALKMSVFPGNGSR